MPNQSSAKKIFITYDTADAHIARGIAEQLKQSGIQTSLGEWEVQPLESISDKIARDLAASDFLVVLVSPASIHSRWIQDELLPFVGRELNERAITVIPIRIGDVELPPALSTRQYLDLEPNLPDSIERLIRRVRSAPLIDWVRLKPTSFERLIEELLQQLGFSILRSRIHRDPGYDFTASYTSRDPFGVEKTETWLVEAKFYKESRVSVLALRQLMGALYAHPKASKAVVLTNGQLTSAAREFLQSQWASKTDLRVVDGTTLTALLSEYPDLCSRFFLSDAKS